MQERTELEHNFFYIQFDNSEEYNFGKLQIAYNLEVGIYKEVREIEYKKPLKESINFSDSELRIYIDLHFDDFIDSISRGSQEKSAANEFYFSYRSEGNNYKEAKIHFTDSYKEQDTKLYNEYKRKEFDKNIIEFQSHKSSLEYVLCKKINKDDFLNSQIILIKDAQED